MKKALVLGAAGFIGQHMEYRLKDEGYFVVSVARKAPAFRKSVADEFNFLDLTNPAEFHAHFFRHDFDEAYQFAGDVGGLGHIAVGTHDADILTNSAKINLNTLEAIRKTQAVGKIFFASSQCVYPDKVEVDPYAQERIAEYSPAHCEADAHFDTFAFGQEKLFAEKLYDAYARNHGLGVRIGRYGNTFGAFSTWEGERAKVPSAICRKVAQAGYGEPVEIWGDEGTVRSFTYIDDAIEGTRRLMDSNYGLPINIASSATVTIMELFEAVLRTSGKLLAPKWVEGPIGVHARGSDNTLCRQVLGWEPSISLHEGLSKTYPWIKEQAGA